MSYANLLRLPAALVLACVGLTAADNIGLGTWKLDNSRSTANGQQVKGSTTVTFTQSGDEITRVAEIVAPDGTKTTSRWTGKLNGKDYPLSEPGWTMSIKQAGKNTMAVTMKRDGKVMSTVTRTLSADGKHIHATIKGTDINGQPLVGEQYLDKQ